MNIAGLIYGLCEHHIDHIAPLCSLLDFPLVVTEEQIYQQVITFYPNVSCTCVSSTQLPFSFLDRFQGVISTLPSQMINLIFDYAKNVSGKCLISIWCPHGNSDKGWKAPFLEALEHEKILLYYGEKMLQFLKEKSIFSSQCAFLSIGDYRWHYYQKNLWFYREKFPKFKIKGTRNILYVPSWSDSEGSGSFVDTLPELVRYLPDDCSLCVKLHPNDLLRMDPKLMQIIIRYEDQVRFIRETPPIYPLLEQTDVMIGDRSSINYDFLRFQKPMFLVNNRNSPLNSCVPSIESWKQLAQMLEKDQTPSFDRRKGLYDYTYDRLEDLIALKQNIIEQGSYFIDE